MNTPRPHPHRRALGIVIAAACVAALPSASALGAAGAIDATFSPGGWSPLGTLDQVESIATQADGKMIVGYAGGGGAWVARVSADGVADPSWTEAVMTGSHIRDLAIQADGKVVVVGDFTQVNGATHYGVARLNTDGTLDASYSPNPNTAVSRAVVLQSDGKAIITGWFSSFGGVVRPTIARLNTDGTLDTSFGVGGTAIQTGGVALGAAALAIQANGKIIIGGDFTAARGVSVNALARLNADGSLDNTFSASAPAGADVESIAIDGSGNLLVGGTFATMAGRGTVNIARLGPNGGGDATWALGGPDASVDAIGIDVNGRVVAGGSFLNVSSAPATHLARFTTAGVRDASFTAAATINNPVMDLEVQPTANVVIGGAFSAIPKLARIDGGATAPGAPTGISAVAGDGSATVSWTAPADAGGIPVTSYTVTGLPGGTCTTATTSCTITGLTAGTPYTFVVKAVNAVGSSTPSGPSTPVIPTGTGGSAASGGAGGAGGGTGATAPAGATPTMASLATRWRVRGGRATATITPRPGATSYVFTATRTGAAPRTGRCKAATVRKAKRVVCTLTMGKGTWTLTAEARTGATAIARATRKATVK